MSLDSQPAPVERLFPFVLRSRTLLVGRDTLWRSRSKLQFVLITTDLSENSRAEVLKDFAPYPIVQHYVSSELEQHFQVHGAKVVGFAKSKLAQSIYAELKAHRINPPAPGASPTAPAAKPAGLVRGNPPRQSTRGAQRERGKSAGRHTASRQHRPTRMR